MPDSTTNLPHHLVLDTSGLNCPEPVMMLHQAIRKSQAGQVVHVIATDPSTMRDIPKFCLHLGHELVQQAEQHDSGKVRYIFDVKKKA